MDLKARVKSVKERTKELGYEIKHTHCQEILATALGERNFHALKAKEEGKSSLTKALDVFLPEKNKEFVMRMGCSSIEDRFEPVCRSVKVSLSPEDFNKIISASKLVNDGVINEFGIELSAKSLIENYHVINKEEDGFDTDFIWLDTKNEDYTFEPNYDYAEDVQFYLRICKFGLQVCGEYSLKSQYLTFTSEDYISLTHLEML